VATSKGGRTVGKGKRERRMEETYCKARGKRKYEGRVSLPNPKNQTSTVIVLEVLSVLGNIVAIVLVTLGIADNITTLLQTDSKKHARTQTQTDLHDTTHAITSASGARSRRASC